MSKVSHNTSTQKIRPLASIKWLKYLGIVFMVLCLYIVAQFYYKYGEDIFSKSLTIAQYIKLSLYSIGSMLSVLFAPLLFFSGALIYRSVRLKGMNALSTLKRDLLIIIPLSLAIWSYIAYIDAPVKGKFYTMLWEVQELQPGEKLTQNLSYKLFEDPNLNGLYNKIDTLHIKIKYEESILEDQLNNNSSTSSYIQELKNEQNKYRNKINYIHFSPIYILLFLLLGMLLGYLIPLKKIALTGILVAIGYIWLYGNYFLEIILTRYALSESLLLLIQISILIIINTVLFIIMKRVYDRSRIEYL